MINNRRGVFYQMSAEWLLYAMIAICFSICPVFRMHAFSASTKQVRLIVTSDLHGWMSTSLVYPDEKRKGLLHIEKGIRQARLEDPDLILLDAGDLLQGSPLVSFFHRAYQDPVAEDLFFKTFQSLTYDAVVVGNHDLGINPLLETKYRPASQFPWLAANLFLNSQPAFTPYIILHRFGLKIAVIGFSTPGAHMWLGEKQMMGIVCKPITTSAAYWVKTVKSRERPDLIIGIFHAGIYPFWDDENSKLNRLPPANSVMETIKKNAAFDLVITGHDHRLVPSRTGRQIRYVRTTPVVQGGRWGEAFIDLNLKLALSKKRWRVVDIKHRIQLASQQDYIKSDYRRQLPEDYLAYIQAPLPYMFTKTSKPSATRCLNLLNALAHSETGVTGSLLPKVRIYKFSGHVGKRLRRLDLLRWFRYDNKTVTVLLSLRDIQMLTRPEPEFGRRRVPGNRLLFPYFRRKLPDFKSNGWWLDHSGFDRIYLVKVSDYHFNGGGGVFPQLFLPPDQAFEPSLVSIHDHLFEYLKQVPELPKECSSLQYIGHESKVESAVH